MGAGVKAPTGPPVSRPAHKRDHLFQAEAFTALLSRLDPSVDPDSAFMWWVNSKDFCPRDRLAIAREVRHILARRGRT